MTLQEKLSLLEIIDLKEITESKKLEIIKRILTNTQVKED